MKAKILLLPGDGIGPEIVSSARRVLECVADKFKHEFVFSEALIGGAAIDAAGHPLPEETVKAAHAAFFLCPKKICIQNIVFTLCIKHNIWWNRKKFFVLFARGLLTRRASYGMIGLFRKNFSTLRQLTKGGAPHGTAGGSSRSSGQFLS